MDDLGVPPLLETPITVVKSHRFTGFHQDFLLKLRPLPHGQLPGCRGNGHIPAVHPVAVWSWKAVEAPRELEEAPKLAESAANLILCYCYV